MGAAPMLAALAATLSAVAAAYQRGDGVPYEEFGTELRHGIAAFNRPAFTNDLAGWLKTMPDVASRLSAGGRVLDLGCGTGWSSIAIAQAFPAARVHGLDTDTASIDEARRHAAHAGVAERVTFTTANAADVPTDQPYDLACAFEALHDMGEPVRVLRAARAALAPGAPVLIVDERVSETFTAPADEVERMMYSFSVPEQSPLVVHLLAPLHLYTLPTSPADPGRSDGRHDRPGGRSGAIRPGASLSPMRSPSPCPPIRRPTLPRRRSGSPMRSSGRSRRLRRIGTASSHCRPPRARRRPSWRRGRRRCGADCRQPAGRAEVVATGAVLADRGTPVQRARARFVAALSWLFCRLPEFPLVRLASWIRFLKKKKKKKKGVFFFFVLGSVSVLLSH